MAQEQKQSRHEQLKSLIGQVEQLKITALKLKSENVIDHLSTQIPKGRKELTLNLREARTLTGHFGKIYAMHWASDSIHLASASQDGKLIVWDGSNGMKRHMINLRSSWVMTCAYSPSRKFVACGGLDNLCSIYPMTFDVPETHDRPQQELSKHEGYLSCCRFLNDQQIITSSGDGYCLLWDIASGRPLSQYSDHTADVMSIAILEGDDNLFVSGSCDHTAKVWDKRVGEKCVQDFVGHESDINAVKWFPSCAAFPCFASGSDDFTVRLFDLRSYTQLMCYQNEQIQGGATAVDFSSTGRYLFAGYDDSPYAAVWDTLAGTKHQDLRGTTRVSCLGVPKTGSCLCTGSWDNNLTIWSHRA